ncbi:MAG: tRNA-binding protein [Saprospiraceae bacterium]|jgi:tRNA-binding protein
MMSECLILGGLGDGKEVILIQPEREVKNGMKIA